MRSNLAADFHLIKIVCDFYRISLMLTKIPSKMGNYAKNATHSFFDVLNINFMLKSEKKKC